MENIARGASRRPIAVSMLLLVVVVLAFIAVSNMYLNLLPSINYPYAIVVVPYMGAGAQEVEELAIEPLEEAVSMVDGVKRFYSTSYDGLGYVFVEFEWGVNAANAVSRLQRSVNAAEGTLPEGVKPIVLEIDPSLMPVYVFSVSDEDLDRAVSIVRRVRGVSTVDIVGRPEKYVEIELDPKRLEKYELNPSVVDYFLMGNSIYPLGQLEDENGDAYQMMADGRFENLDELGNLIVGFKGMKSLAAPNVGNRSLPITIPVRLKQVAEIKIVPEDVHGEIHVNGRTQTVVAVRKRTSTNTVEVVRRIRGALRENGIAYEEIMDQSQFTERAVNNLMRNLLIGAIVSSLVVLFFLRGFLPMLVIALSIPLSLTMALTLLYFFGIDLDLLTLGGLTMAVGMLVDNSIVVFENIYRHKSMGEGYQNAAGRGTAEVGGAIFASTVTTVSVFLPFLFVKSFAATLFKYFALSFALALASSLLVAVLVIPAASRWIKPREWEGFERFRDWYTRVLERALDRKWIVTVIALGAFVFATFAILKRPFSFMPEMTSDTVQFSFEAPPQYPYTKTAALVSEIENEILNRKKELGIDVVYSEIGVASIYSQVFGASENKAVMYVRLSDDYRMFEKRYRELVEIVRAKKPSELKMESSTSSQELSIVFGNPISIRVYGNTLDEIKEKALKLKERLLEIPGVERVKTSVDELREVINLKIERNAAAVSGMIPAQTFEQLQPYTVGKEMGSLEIGGEVLPLKLKMTESKRVDDISRLPLWNTLGNRIFLGMITRMRHLQLPFGIEHNMGKRVAYVDVTEISEPLGEVSKRIEDVLKSDEFRDLDYEIGGQKKSLDENLGDLEFSIFIAVILVFMFLAAQTESLKRPFVIFLTVPAAAVGAAIATLAFDLPINVPVLIGALTLVGVVVNNAIVMVALIDQYRREMPLRQAIVQGVRNRLRPILMSSFTTIIGLTPVAVFQAEGSQIESPIAWTVILGLLISMLFTLFLIPAAYEVLERKKSRGD